MTNAAGCDSLVTLHLTINHTTDGDTTAAACDSIRWYGNTYIAPGDYYHILSSVLPSHCDSILTLHLTVNHSVATDITDSICTGSTYFFAGQYIVESGTYNKVLTSAVGCDSTIRLHLTVLERPTLTIDSSHDCLQGLYFLRANTSVDYIHWSSSVGWPAEWGSDMIRNLTVHINRPTVFTIFADYHSYHTCPVITSFTVNPLVQPSAVMQVTPEFLTNGSLTFNAVSHSRNYEWLKWFIDGDEVSNNYAHGDVGGSANNDRITYTADNSADSVIVSLLVMNQLCSDTAEKTIYVRRSSIFAPNVFTPDEATNQTFSIICNGVIEYELTIYTRQGLFVYSDKASRDEENNLVTAPWDGTKNGAPCPQGFYVWVIRYRGIAQPQNWYEEKGSVLMLR
jgi:hypothetical protein